MIVWISRFLGRLGQNHQGNRIRNPDRTQRKWETFLEADLRRIVKATENDRAARNLLRNRLAAALDVLNKAKGERQEIAMAILTAAFKAAADERREAERRGATTFGDLHLAAASAAEAWFLVTIQHRQGQIDHDTLCRIENLIDQLRSPG